MPRRRVIATREITPDPKYGDTLLAKLVNNLMVDGKKRTAEDIVHGALILIADQLKKQAKKSTDEDEANTPTSGQSGSQAAELVFLRGALSKICPRVELRSRRVGGATYQVPVHVDEKRSMALGMRWLIDAARKRSEKGMVQRLYREITDAFNEKGTAFKKCQDVYKMAKANEAYAHLNR